MAITKEKIISLITRWLPWRISAGNSSSTEDRTKFTDSQIDRALQSLASEEDIKHFQIQNDGIVQTVPCKHDARYRFDPDAPGFSFDGYVRHSADVTCARLVDHEGRVIFFSKAVFLKYFKKV